MEMTPGLLVYAAFACNLIGFLARDELFLRLWMLGASSFYVLYYFNVADTPLWDALITNGVLGVANAGMILVVIYERTIWGMSAEQRALYAHFQSLSPGQYRRLLRAGQMARAEAAQVLTEQGQPVAQLFFVIDGALELEKSGAVSRLAGPLFVGELAFLTQGPASARVTLEPEARYVVWDAAALQRLLDKSPKLAVAFQAQINGDLVRKVAQSRPGLGAS